MGIFNKIFNSPKNDNKNLAENIEKKKEWFENWWMKNEEDKWEESERLLKKIGESFLEPKILNLKNDSNVELRAKCEDYPFRVIFSAYGFGLCDLEMKHISPFGFIELEYNPDLTNDKEVEDEWNEKDDYNCRLFFAKSVFIKGFKSDLDETANKLSGLPPEFIKSLINLMINNRIRYYRVRPSLIEINFLNALIEMTQDPVNLIVSTVRMMALFAKTAGSSVPNAKTRADFLVTCTFCKSLQYFSSDGCCNCGAPIEKLC